MADHSKSLEVDKLTGKPVSFPGTSNEEADKSASEHKTAQESSLSMRDRMSKSLAMARAAGPFAPGDHKRETDEMWGDGACCSPKRP
ncbi:protein transcription factor [Bosea sp. UC22_33]|uniref:protein transcription factor n=1 Tax=Bosea sp. UC22_33 TaxID=3350165 RepID=UPI003672CE05